MYARTITGGTTISDKTYCWHIATRGRYKGQPVKCRSNPCSLHSDAEHIKAGTRDAAMAITEDRERDDAMPATPLTRSRSATTEPTPAKSAPTPVTTSTPPAPMGVGMLEQCQRPTARAMLDAAAARGLDVTISGDIPSYYDEYDEPLNPPDHAFVIAYGNRKAVIGNSLYGKGISVDKIIRGRYESSVNAGDPLDATEDVMNFLAFKPSRW